MTSENATDFKSALRVGKLSVGKVALDTDWTPYTLAITASTTAPTLGAFAAGSRFMYRIVGKTLEMKMAYTAAAGASAGSGYYRFNVPPGCLIRTQSVYGPAGQGIVSEIATPLFFQGVVIPDSQTTFFLELVNTAAATGVSLKWGTSAAATLQGNAAHSAAINATFELDPASPILN